MSLCTLPPHQVLFFARLFADVGGRSTLKVKALVLDSRPVLLALGCACLAAVPVYFVYIVVMHWHNDYVITGACALTSCGV